MQLLVVVSGTWAVALCGPRNRMERDAMATTSAADLPARPRPRSERQLGCSASTGREVPRSRPMTSRPNTALSQIHMQVMWSRLIAVVEEQAQTLVRTAFSTTVREAGDLSAGVFDRDGHMLAQAVTGTPGHVNSMAAAVKHF